MYYWATVLIKLYSFCKKFFKIDSDTILTVIYQTIYDGWDPSSPGKLFTTAARSIFDGLNRDPECYDKLTEQSNAPNVVFVSFLRDIHFWRDSSRRLGFNFDQAIKNGQLFYVDGATELFNTTTDRVSSISASGSRYTISDSRLSSIAAMVSDILVSAQTATKTKPLCIIDGLDFLLASTETGSAEMLSTLMAWRASSYAMIMAVSADQPLIHAQQTPLDIEHAAFITGLVHQAHLVISVRLLSTGAAKDVSGVIRISRGGSIDDIYESRVDEKEVLYLVASDGMVNVFERGA